MSPRRLSTVTFAGLLLTALASPARAADPVEGVPDAEAVRPLTSQEQRIADRKLGDAQRYLRTAAALDGIGTRAACPSPNGPAAEALAAGSPSAACYVPSGILSVEARDQLFGHYCGPAVGQVISNYAWAMGSGQNKWTQQQISGWMGTDVHLQTNAYALAGGLNQATGGAPRPPANWSWVVQLLADTNGNRTAADEWHGYVRSNVSSSRMPLAIAVKPHQPGATYYLTSWPREVASVGHWITVYGWKGYYDYTDFARVFYADSSRDEGGSTGKFSDPSRRVYILVAQHMNRIVW